MPLPSALDSDDAQCAVRLADGVEFTRTQARNGIGHQHVPALVDAWVDDAALDYTADNFLQMGDCCLDGFQAAFWLMKQRELLACPSVVRMSSSPVLVCGSGPSLDGLLPEIKALQGKVIIVCAHSTLDRLVAAGIEPDVCCPSERVQYANQIQGEVPLNTWYAGLPIVPHDYKRFHRHLLATSGTPIFHWAGCPGKVGGSTSGIMAASVGLELSSGPTYLCGFDMVHGHCSGYNHHEIPADSEAKCVDGAMRPTTQLYLRTQTELSLIFRDEPVVQCSPTGLPILSRWAMSGTLPSPQSLPKAELRHESLERRGQWLVTQLEERMRSLRAEWLPIIARVKRAETIADCSAHAIAGEHAQLLSYVLYSLYAQLSIERRLGRAEAIPAWFRTAAGNVLDGLTGYVMEATRGCA